MILEQRITLQHQFTTKNRALFTNHVYIFRHLSGLTNKDGLLVRSYLPITIICYYFKYTLNSLGISLTFACYEIASYFVNAFYRSYKKFITSGENKRLW